MGFFQGIKLLVTMSSTDADRRGDGAFANQAEGPCCQHSVELKKKQNMHFNINNNNE